MAPRRTCLITGANAGIGRAAAFQLASAGHSVLLGCRDLKRGQEAAEGIRAAASGAEVSVVELDCSLQASIRKAVERIGAVDVVIHNAAYFDIREKKRLLTEEGIERTWATNYLGPALLTELLLPRLLESQAPAVVAVTSKGLMMYPRLVVDLEDPEFERRRFSVPSAYYQSKLAHLAWMLNLAERLHDTPVKVFGVRVTNVKVDITRYPGLSWLMRTMYAMKSAFSISPEEMARTYTWLAVGDEPAAQTGTYWDRIGVPAKVSAWAADPGNRALLAEWTARQIGKGALVVG